MYLRYVLHMMLTYLESVYVCEDLDEPQPPRWGSSRPPISTSTCMLKIQNLSKMVQVEVEVEPQRGGIGLAHSSPLFF